MRITTVALEMVLPAVFGMWIDHWLGTVAAFTVVGAGLGLCLGMWHLLRMTSRSNNPSQVTREKQK